jgi:hypothetical protein
MALRKPLVQVAGQIQQLQAGDSLDIEAETINQTNDEAGAIVVGTPVYSDAADGVKKAQANASATKDVLGLVAAVSIANGASGAIALDGILVATTAQWDVVAGTTGGLTFKTRYYLDPATAGKITATPPSTVGQYIVEIGIALSTTELKIDIMPSILL